MSRLGSADRRSLLLGTALATTLLVGTVIAPAPAKAVDCVQPASPQPIDETAATTPITCVNTVPRAGTEFSIGITTQNPGSFIDLFNSGVLTPTNNAGTANGIHTRTTDPTSPIDIQNIGAITANGSTFAHAIRASSDRDDGPITILNTGALTANAGTQDADGIRVQTSGANSFISISTSGDIRSAAGDQAYGIYARTSDTNARISLNNSGKMTVTAANDAYGIYAFTSAGNSRISIVNSGDLMVAGGDDAYGINARTQGAAGNSPVSIANSGDIRVTAAEEAYGIYAFTFTPNSPISIANSGDIWATSNLTTAFGLFARSRGGAANVANSGDIAATGYNAFGIFAQTEINPGAVNIVNSGALTANAFGEDAFGIRAQTAIDGSPINIVNSGPIVTTGPQNNGVTDSSGIHATTNGENSAVNIANSGDVRASGFFATGIYARTTDDNSPVNVANSGDLWATGLRANAIRVETFAPGNAITIVNSGGARASGTDTGYGIYARTTQANSPILIQNSGIAFGNTAGIVTNSFTGTTIVNSGRIGAESQLAIGVEYGPAGIFNTGIVNGFVLLDADDTFINQAGGTFNARQTSDFDAYGLLPGNDLFVNQAGATVHTAAKRGVAETTAFINLETFRNQGLISTQDNGTGDRFILSNTPGGTDLNFVASGDSTVALDASLGGAGSPSDLFIVQGNVKGTTAVEINNTNAGPGVFNPTGIPVIFVDGATPQANAFYLPQPLDAGFFDYDLFFVPTNSGFWELRSFPGGGAHLLPQLVTAAQDIWHEGSSTWFDRTADLRVLLAGGVAPPAYGGKDLGAASPYSITPAVWARGSGSWLERDDSASTTAYGRNYRFDLERDLTTVDFQVGLDLGHRDLLTPGDILVFGMLGGFVHGDLDYDTLVRKFDFDGGQVGAYATYLRGGLFVDSLLNAHLYELDTATRGFPDTLDASTIGLRTDSGYRFGSFSGGPFLEPLATIEVLWADIDGFSLGGNTVSFDDDPGVRGRLGLRAGTTMDVWEGTVMEPFVIGSLWGNFTDDNQATLISTGRTFQFQDDLTDVWGEVSGGLNFFNPAAGTAVFAKLDVTFGDEVTGVGGKAGMRVAW